MPLGLALPFSFATSDTQAVYGKMVRVRPRRYLKEVDKHLKVSVSQWPQYFQRDTTRREHLRELYVYLGLQDFTAEANKQVVRHLTELAIQTDQGLVLAEEMVFWLRQHNTIVPHSLRH